VSVKGSDEYEGMPRNERSRISGWDSRKAAKSGSSLASFLFGFFRLVPTTQDAPDGSHKRD
jgi:hypothetical protein